jgi:hypothetical protein
VKVVDRVSHVHIRTAQVRQRRLGESDQQLLPLFQITPAPSIPVIAVPREERNSLQLLDGCAGLGVSIVSYMLWWNWDDYLQ